MSLSHRAVAVQGLGFAPRVLAVQGFASVVMLFARAPLGGGFAARPAQGLRPTQMLTSRAGQSLTDRATSSATHRPGQNITTRPRR